MSKYEDMWYMSHPVSKKHPQMSLYDRAAQFSPFAALTGHEAAIQEEARLTEAKVELDESEKEQLNETLRELLERYDGHPEVTVTYFQPDTKKEGGTYVTESGKIRKLDIFRRVLLLDGGQSVELDQIIRVEDASRGHNGENKCRS